VTLVVQGIVFGTMLLTGALLGLWIDLFRLINRRGKTPFPVFLDLLFWAVITCVVFVVLINVNFLELRLYVFFSMGLGLYSYFKLLSRHVLQLYVWGFGILVKMLKWTWWIVRPLALPLRAASGLLDNIILAALTLIASIFVRIRFIKF